MFSLKNKKKISLNYPQHPLLSGALISSVTGLLHNRIIGGPYMNCQVKRQ